MNPGIFPRKGTRMIESNLLKLLEMDRIDSERLPKNFYSGGMASACRIRPENVIVFFMRHRCLRKDTELCCHHRFQIKINLGPESIFGIEEMRFRLPPDSGMLIFPFQTHYVALGNGSEKRHHLTISFSDHTAEGERSLFPLRNYPFPIAGEDLQILRRIVAASQGKSEISESEAVISLELFLARKLEQSKEHFPFSKTLPEHPVVSRLFEFVRENFEHPLSVKELAAGLNLSESHLRRIAGKCFNGISLGSLLLGIRHGHAAELLCRSAFSLSEIAEKCGYSDAFSFSRAFKRTTGISPSVYRQKYS